VERVEPPEGETMRANTPEEICNLFKQYMGDGNLEALLDIYDHEAVFLGESGETSMGKPQIREQLAPLAAAKAVFDFDIKQVIRSRDIALMHTHWKVSSPQPRFVYAIEVARRQPDGSWCWLIGDPFTVGRNTSALAP
jgi:ketosteroid isomerase-like protein